MIIDLSTSLEHHHSVDKRQAIGELGEGVGRAESSAPGNHSLLANSPLTFGVEILAGLPCVSTRVGTSSAITKLTEPYETRALAPDAANPPFAWFRNDLNV